MNEVAHYIKSNLDGSKPTRVSIFVVAPDRLEVAKVEKDVNDAAWVRAHFDWKLFTSDRMDAAVINLDGSVEERATFVVDRAKGAVDVTVGDRKGSAAWKQLPFHVYNFDFTSLNFAWRHLIDPKAPFTIGIIDPTFQKDGPLVFYRGDARIVYTGEDEIRGKTCRSYRISGPGIENTTGTIWWDPQERLARESRDPVPRQPGLEQLQARASEHRAHDPGRLEEVRRGFAGESQRGRRELVEAQGRGAPRFARNSFCFRIASARIAANSVLLRTGS